MFLGCIYNFLLKSNNRLPINFSLVFPRIPPMIALSLREAATIIPEKEPRNVRTQVARASTDIKQQGNE